MSATRSAVLAVLAAGAAAAAGTGVVYEPQVAFLLSVTALCLAALAAPAGAWVLAAVVAALTFKGLGALGGLPSVATFLDLPLAWGALLVALLKQPARSRLATGLLWWLSGLTVAVLLAWAFNPSEVLRPVLDLMLLGEPFAIVIALLLDPPSHRLRRALQGALLVLIIVQLPFSAFELAKLGAGDKIQGTLYSAGAGAHVISAIAVVGAIWIVAGGGREGLGIFRFPLAAALLCIPFVADAKQVIVALPATVLAVTWRGGPLGPVVRIALAAGSVAVLFVFIPAGSTSERFIQQAQHGKGGKQAAAGFVWRQVSEDPAAIFFGKGPAETVSRAAFMTTPGFQKSGFQNAESPLAVLGLKPAVIAKEAQHTAFAASGGGTSFNTGVSSALGVFGDLGFFGLSVYVGLLLTLFASLRKDSSPEAVAAASGFAMFLVLGIVFDWWEQPPFGVFLGTLAGLALSRTQWRDRPAASLSGPGP
jgi:hypothetical protein